MDAQLSPGTARWLSSRFAIEAIPVRDLGLRESTDRQIFEAARTAGAVVMTKDRDFVEMVVRRGPPPQVVWVTVGNTSDQRLRGVLGRVFPDVIEILAAGEPLVEIGLSAKAP